MIAALRGELIRLEEEWAVLDVGGVGYQVYVHARTAAELVGRSGPVTLQIHTAVREDAISLYGFLSAQELAFFRELLNVERIGPKAALAILSRAEWGSLIGAIAAEDHTLLATVPGIGPKTARRIVLELKGRIESLVPQAAAPVRPPAGPSAERAVEALQALGFAGPEARRVVGEELAEGDGAERTIEDVVRGSLRRLNAAAVVRR